jgi:hypothetical protein
VQLFHEIPEGAVILRTRGGVFRQAKVYRRGEHIYAGHAGGFVRLLRYSGTSVPTTTWWEIEADGVDTTGVPRWIGSE